MVRVFDKIEESPAIAQHGQVMTKPHIVELILDLCGYDHRSPLHQLALFDPGCGDGQFIVAAAERLFEKRPKNLAPLKLIPCLLGIEKDNQLAETARSRLAKVGRDAGISKHHASVLADSWIQTGDFLRSPFSRRFDFVVGNPPYVRQEAIAKADLAFLRDAFPCFYDRADLYLAFLEKGLSLLSDRGVLGFICPNRFTKNRYGKKLRALIADRFRLSQAIDLAQGSPFEPEVLAYPGIYIVGQGKTEAVDFFHMTNGTKDECAEIIRALAAPDKYVDNGVRHHTYRKWFSGEEPWVTESPHHLALARRLETTFPTLGSPESGTQVGIGVATGADRVFIVRDGFDGVEPQLLVPLVMTADCVTGNLKWGGRHVINPFAPGDGNGLIDLATFPLARKYFHKHESHLRKRNVGKRNPNAWFRTIDRIYPSLLKKNKLLIPDIKADGVIALDEGKCYPHHNLYYVISDFWSLRALRTILRSSLARFFVWIYGVRMRCDFLRFQTQYLRRIPVPSPMTLQPHQFKALERLDETDRQDLIDHEVSRFYGLSNHDVRLISDALGRQEPES